MSDVEAMLDKAEAQVDDIDVGGVEVDKISDDQQNADMPDSADLVVSKVGRLTRQLHESLRELGFQNTVERAALEIPDAQDRLSYVARMTEEAAQRTLSATESAQPIQERISVEAVQLDQRWQRLFDRELSIDEFKLLVGDTRSYLSGLPQQTAETNSHLHEIMMAQSFQDLTGQVIKRVSEVTRNIETDLLRILVDHVPPERRAASVAPEGLLNGPAVSPADGVDVVGNQAQVDDLLESLGF